MLRRQPDYNDELRGALPALEQLMGDERTLYARRGVTRLVDVVHPFVRRFKRLRRA